MNKPQSAYEHHFCLGFDYCPDWLKKPASPKAVFAQAWLDKSVATSQVAEGSRCAELFESITTSLQFPDLGFTNEGKPEGDSPACPGNNPPETRNQVALAATGPHKRKQLHIATDDVTGPRLDSSQTCRPKTDHGDPTLQSHVDLPAAQRRKRGKHLTREAARDTTRLDDAYPTGDMIGSLAGGQTPPQNVPVLWESNREVSTQQLTIDPAMLLQASEVRLEESSLDEDVSKARFDGDTWSPPSAGSNGKITGFFIGY